MLALYGHPFSSYTWKALIALYANDTPFEFRMVDEAHPQHAMFVQSAGPAGKFPVLSDGFRTVFEASAIVEYLHLHHPGPAQLLPADPAAAQEVRMIDRVFDLQVMDAMQELVLAHISSPGSPDPEVEARVSARLARSYVWIERWLETASLGDAVTLIECAAAPALFYADWVLEIPANCPRLRAWRTSLLALPAVKRCVDDARPYRHFFPPGAPDRD